MNLKRVIGVSSFAVLAVSAMAQGFPGGGQGGPPGPPPGGFGGPGGPGGMPPTEMLLHRPDVQDDLNLSQDQKAQLQQLDQSMRQQMNDMRQNGGEQDPEARHQAMESFHQKMKEAVNKILTADQQKRVKEIGIQVAGSRAAFDPDVQKDLNLTSDQKSQLQTLMQKEREANGSVFQKMQIGEISRQSAQQSFQTNQQAVKAAIDQILTSDQRAQLKAMAGKPFKGSSQGFGPGGFGPGGPPPGEGGPGGPPPGGGGPGGEEPQR